jgi:pimeloyl-ACP methyl ester carboxylesterase
LKSGQFLFFDMLAEFASVVEAVNCAVEIQTGLKAENGNLPAERRMEFRIGVNLGDVMVEGPQIYGDGVNVAARLEGLADPGGICISGTAHDQVRDKLGLAYEDAGEQAVKNIARPVHVWRVLLEGATSPPRKTRQIPRKYWRGGALSLTALAIAVVMIVLVQHLSLKPQRTHASIVGQSHQTISFCRTTDGVRIAYATTGAGPPVVMLMGWFTNLEAGFLSPLYAGSIIDQLSTDHLLVRYDGRGFGLSDRGIHDYSLEARLRDLDAVVSSLGLHRFALFGISSGAQTAVAYAARHPDRISRLVLYGSIPKSPPLSAKDRANFSAFITIIRVGWGNDNSAFRQIFTNTLMPDGTDNDVHVFNEIERSSATGEDAAAFMAANLSIDVTAAASEVRAPTLVIHRRGDRMVPFQFGREMAALIPGARLLAVDGSDHLFVPGDPRNDQIAEVVRQFLYENVAK